MFNLKGREGGKGSERAVLEGNTLILSYLNLLMGPMHSSMNKERPIRLRRIWLALQKSERNAKRLRQSERQKLKVRASNWASISIII